MLKVILQQPGSVIVFAAVKDIANKEKVWFLWLPSQLSLFTE